MTSKWNKGSQAVALVLVCSVPALFSVQAIATLVTYEVPAEVASLAPGPDVDIAMANCGACHSVDYITTQPRKKGRVFWNAIVTKMIKVFHAPISEADAKTILDYLEAAY